MKLLSGKYWINFPQVHWNTFLSSEYLNRLKTGATRWTDKEPYLLCISSYVSLSTRVADKALNMKNLSFLAFKIIRKEEEKKFIIRPPMM